MKHTHTQSQLSKVLPRIRKIPNRAAAGSDTAMYRGANIPLTGKGLVTVCFIKPYYPQLHKSYITVKTRKLICGEMMMAEQ